MITAAKVQAAVRDDVTREFGSMRYLRQISGEGAKTGLPRRAEGLPEEIVSTDAAVPIYDPETDRITLPADLARKMAEAYRARGSADSIAAYYRVLLQSYSSWIPERAPQDLTDAIVEELVARLVRVKLPWADSVTNGDERIQRVLEDLSLGGRSQEDAALKKWLVAPDPTTYIQALARNRHRPASILLALPLTAVED